MQTTSQPTAELLDEIRHFSPESVSKNLMKVHDRALYEVNMELDTDQIQGLYIIKVFSDIIAQMPEDIGRSLEKAS